MIELDDDLLLGLDDLGRLSPWQFRQLWEGIGEALYLKARAANGRTPQLAQKSKLTPGSSISSDSSPSTEEPEPEPLALDAFQSESKDDPPATAAALESEPPVSLNPSPELKDSSAEPVDPWCYCVTCGYEAPGPATLNAHKKIHAPAPPPKPVHTGAGDLASTMSAEEEARWVAAMQRGQKVTDDGPSPIDPEPEPTPDPPRFEVIEASKAPPAVPLEIPRLTNPANCCQFCGKECGGVAGRRGHESRCEERPMAKREGCQHRWRMEPPNGPVIHGECRDCGATRQDPASPTPLVGTGATHKSESRVFDPPPPTPAVRKSGTGAYPRPDVTCPDCGVTLKGYQALGNHRVHKHPEAVAG